MGFPNQRVIDMVLTDNQIRALCTKGTEKALITPFNEDALQSESYDLCIDDEVSLLKKDVRYIELEDRKK
jgi:dCTP deaminase